MKEASGLVFAFVLDGNGSGTPLDLDGIHKWCPDDGPLWVHMDFTKSTSRDWVQNHSGIDPIIVDALMAEETRPRSLVHNGGMLVILRGVNLNPGKDPEDMISTRFWIDQHKIVTLSRDRVMAITDLRQALETGNGPVSSGSFLEDLADRLALRMGTVVSNVEDSVDALEDEGLLEQTYALRQKIGNIRRTAIGLRRYLAPQRDVMARLYNEKVEWLNDMERMRLREVADRTTRYVEDLDAIRDRATVTQEELNGRLAEQMNKTMYVLSIVAGIFLPLGLLTGLLGINVGGIPGTENPWAFTVFCIILFVVAGLQVWLFKRKRWM